MKRLVIVPDPENLEFGRRLQPRLSKIALGLTAQNLGGLIDDSVLRLARAIQGDANKEYVLWGQQEGQFEAAWTSGDQPQEIVGVAVCEAASGLVAEVFTTQSARRMDEPILQAEKFTNLGEHRGKVISTMVGLPVSVAGACIGVLTSVSYGTAPEGESASNAREADLAAIFGIATERRLIHMCLGFDAAL